jgi:hypothetical protein
MEKKIIKILTIGKNPKSLSSLVLFDIATEKKYDLIIFLPDDEKDYLEIILINPNNISYSYFEEKFHITIKRDEEGYYSNFKISNIEKLKFYQILKENFEIERKNLSQI